MIVSAPSSGFVAAVVNRWAMSLLTSRRQVLSLSLAPLFVRHARAADTPRFALGVASGHPKPDRLVLWTRLSGADLPDKVDVRWELAHDEAFTDIATG